MVGVPQWKDRAIRKVPPGPTIEGNLDDEMVLALGEQGGRV